MHDRLIDMAEHNRITGLGRSSTYEMERAGVFKGVRLGRMLRFSENEAFAWVEAKKAEAAAMASAA